MKLSLARVLPLAIALLIPSAALAEEPAGQSRLVAAGQDRPRVQDPPGPHGQAGEGGCQGPGQGAQGPQGLQEGPQGLQEGPQGLQEGRQVDFPSPPGVEFVLRPGIREARAARAVQECATPVPRKWEVGVQ